MTDESWASKVAKVAAAEVRRYRDLQGMSAQQLSDACAELGHPIARSVLANFESGRRPTLSVAELLVIAEALEVPPTSLVFPVGYAPTVEVLPGIEYDTYRAAQWWAGFNTPNEARPAKRVGFVLYDEHQDFVRDIAASRAQARKHLENAARLDEERDKDLRAALFDLSKAAESQAEQAEEVLWEIRSEIRRSGMTPPVLPSELDDLVRYDAHFADAEPQETRKGDTE
ncbi:helix-turn-helix domain-containing protein [Streptomyces sp. NPDC015532]|uniref:helix-turn-helix domain-containing protein n=1 Tax=Streptomyces sp. NPDC015532 TaxID=3364960 RepID=UPI0036FA5877